MKWSTLLIFLFAAIASCVEQNELDFPEGPHLEITPGKLCYDTKDFRYPEKIAYCVREVSPQQKFRIMQKYDQTYGYRIQQMVKDHFKVDHLIPICMGGSNDAENLWPQHKSIYAITDPLEPLLCEKMAAGKIKQAEAVKYIINAKTDLSKVKGIIEAVTTL